MNRLDEPVFMAVSKPLLTEFGIHYRLESCEVVPVSLWQVHAATTVVAGLRGTLVNVDFAVWSGESSRAEALGPVVDGGAETPMLAAPLRTNHVHATVLGRRPSSKGLLS